MAIVHQKVELRLTRMDDNRPLAVATVDMAPLKRLFANQEQLTDREWTQKHHWNPALTSSSGVAVLELRQGIGHGPFRPKYPDFVRRRSMLLAVSGVNCDDEIEITDFEIGRQANGDCASVEVLSISKPRPAK